MLQELDFDRDQDSSPDYEEWEEQEEEEFEEDEFVDQYFTSPDSYEDPTDLDFDPDIIERWRREEIERAEEAEYEEFIRGNNVTDDTSNTERERYGDFNPDPRSEPEESNINPGSAEIAG